MARLTREQQLFIVDGYACYMTTREVCDQFEEVFGWRVTPDQACRYNPDIRAARPLSQSLAARHRETRARYWEETGSIPLAHKTHRLRLLSDMEIKAREKGNLVLAASLIEQAAKEAGNVFSNKVEVRQSGTIKHEHREMTEDQKRTMLENAILDALDKQKVLAPRLQ